MYIIIFSVKRKFMSESELMIKIDRSKIAKLKKNLHFEIFKFYIWLNSIYFFYI